MSINRGVPIVVDQPNHPVSKAIRDLALDRIASRAQRPGGRGLRGRFGRADHR
jgi:pilus assembly protein CpaE